MPEIDATFLWALPIVFLAAAMSGLAGFGFSIVSVPALLAQGLISRDDVVLSLLLAPAAVAGRWVGSLLVPYVTPARFRRVVLVLLLATGAVAIVNAQASM